MVPVFLFVPLSAMQQSIPVTDLGSRMEFGLAMLFTNVTFKFSIASTLPHISYLTLLDKYLLVAGLINLLICFGECRDLAGAFTLLVFHVITTTSRKPWGVYFMVRWYTTKLHGPSHPQSSSRGMDIS